jgi:hypothetical protein
VDKEEKEEKKVEEDKQEQGEVTLPRNPLDNVDPSKKRKVSPTKPTSRNKSKERNPKCQTILTIDDFYFIIAAVSDASKDIFQNNKAKQESLYDIIATELRGVQ